MSLTFAYLADRPEAVPQIAQWWFEEWGHLAPGETVEDIISHVNGLVIHWMEPRELSRAAIQSRIAEMLDRGEAVHILTADGRIGTISGSSLTFYGSAEDVFDQWISPH